MTMPMGDRFCLVYDFNCQVKRGPQDVWAWPWPSAWVWFLALVLACHRWLSSCAPGKQVALAR